MKSRMKLKTELWKIVPASILIMVLLSTMASSNADVQGIQQDNMVKFDVKNVGTDPMYVLNALIVFDSSGNTIYSSQKLSSAEVLKLEPGAIYTFEWNTENVPEGKYTAKIYQGDEIKSLIANPVSVELGRKPAKPVLYTDRKFYESGESVSVTFQNNGIATIYANVNNWEITNLDTGTVVYTLSRDCSYGYGGCADSFEPFGFMEYIEQTWDQKDTGGNQVASGSYMVTAEYSESSSGVPNDTISTKKFIIRTP